MVITADAINTNVRNALLRAGFKGVLPSNKAKHIIKEILKEFCLQQYKIEVEMRVLHCDKGICCDCDRSLIKVQPHRI